MTTNEALPNPVSAPIPPLEITPDDFCYPSLVWKVAGHAVVGVLVRCRPREVTLYPRIWTRGFYPLDKRHAKGERAAMVTLGGYAALTIAEGMSGPPARGFRGATLCNDWHKAKGCLHGNSYQRETTVRMLLTRVHELLYSEWSKVQAVATRLDDYGYITGPDLGRIVRARPEDLAAASR